MRVRQRGFTLIEMMIVAALVGVLAAIAYPSYSQYQKRAKRSAAETFMMDVANRQQQYFLDQRIYAGDTTCTTTGLATLSVTVPVEVSGFYDVCIIQANATPPPTFTIRATPKAGSMMAGDGILTLDDRGNKLVGGVVSEKWQGR
ncbi:MAG TPA: type IV pilin protein [Casimicrobiaceae bacterium]|jgi:type IV pilus assembly protein PilE